MPPQQYRTMTDRSLAWEARAESERNPRYAGKPRAPMPIRSRSRRLGRGWDTETSIPFFEAGGFPYPKRDDGKRRVFFTGCVRVGCVEFRAASQGSARVARKLAARKPNAPYGRDYSSSSRFFKNVSVSVWMTPGPGMVAQRPLRRGPGSIRYMFTPRTRVPFSATMAQLVDSVLP